MITVKIHADPEILLYRRADLRPLGAAYPYLLDVGDRRAELGGNNPTLSITLDNRNGQSSALLADPPLRALAEVFEDSEIVIAGSIARVDLAEQAILAIEG